MEKKPQHAHTPQQHTLWQTGQYGTSTMNANVNLMPYRERWKGLCDLLHIFLLLSAFSINRKPVCLVSVFAACTEECKCIKKSSCKQILFCTTCIYLEVNEVIKKSKVLYSANLLLKYMSHIKEIGFMLQFLQQLDLWELFLGNEDLAHEQFFFPFFCDDNDESVKHVPAPQKNIVLISFSEAGKLWEWGNQKSSKWDYTFKRLRVLQCWTSNFSVIYFWSPSPARICALGKKNKTINFVINCSIVVDLTLNIYNIFLNIPFI